LKENAGRNEHKIGRETLKKLFSGNGHSMEVLSLQKRLVNIISYDLLDLLFNPVRKVSK